VPFSLQGVATCVKDVGVGFMLAPRYHPAMKLVAPVRKSLKVKTAFNILGPMLNPARAPHSIVGVYHENLVRRLQFCVTIVFGIFLL
jgi:anthranilate phosphoribosyltransferase